MKFAKNISLFILYPLAMTSLGFLGGVMFMNFFYPERFSHAADSTPNSISIVQKAPMDGHKTTKEIDPYPIIDEGTPEDGNYEKESSIPEEDLVEPEPETASVLAVGDRINADTQYVLEETDIRNHSVVETTWRIPPKYIGMNREQFLETMDEYEASPPLSELERGFVGLEVLSFSSERVVVQMNYEYTQPSTSFYLKVRNNFVVVYLDDQETVYMDTDILLTELPDKVQQDIINVLFVPDEESLYGFLETYSS